MNLTVITDVNQIKYFKSECMPIYFGFLEAQFFNIADADSALT